MNKKILPGSKTRDQRVSASPLSGLHAERFGPSLPFQALHCFFGFTDPLAGNGFTISANFFAFTKEGPYEIRFVLLLERLINIKLLEFLYVSLFVFRKYVDKDSFLCNIFIFVGAGLNLFIGVYYLSLVILRIRHWKKFIIRNSPIQTASLVYTL